MNLSWSCHSQLCRQTGLRWLYCILKCLSSVSCRTFTWSLNLTQRDRQVDRQAGREGCFGASLLPVSSRPRSALVGGIQGPRSCKQKPDPVRRAWVSPPRTPADDTRSGPALGTGLIWCLTKGPSLRLSITAHIWCLCRERCPFRFLWGVKARIRPSHCSLRNPLTQTIHSIYRAKVTTPNIWTES